MIEARRFRLHICWMGSTTVSSCSCSVSRINVRILARATAAVVYLDSHVSAITLNVSELAHIYRYVSDIRQSRILDAKRGLVVTDETHVF